MAIGKPSLYMKTNDMLHSQKSQLNLTDYTFGVISANLSENESKQNLNL